VSQFNAQAEIVTDKTAAPASRVTAATTPLDRGDGKPFMAVGVAHGSASDLAQFLAEIDGRTRGLPSRQLIDVTPDLTRPRPDPQQTFALISI